MVRRIPFAKRRSPIYHPVKTHMRNGIQIRQFWRGQGTAKPTKSRVVGAKDDSVSIGPHAWVVNFTYGPDDGESVIAFSDSYEGASDEAWEERKDNRIPISVEIIDPDIGSALKWMGSRAKAGYEFGKPKISKATKLGAKYAVRVGKAGVSTGKETFKLATFGAHQKFVEALIRKCYQKDRVKRLAARQALKKTYPEIYALCDFSKPTGRRSRSPPKVIRFPTRYRVQH